SRSPRTRRYGSRSGRTHKGAEEKKPGVQPETGTEQSSSSPMANPASTGESSAPPPAREPSKPGRVEKQHESGKPAPGEDTGSAVVEKTRQVDPVDSSQVTKAKSEPLEASAKPPADIVSKPEPQRQAGAKDVEPVKPRETVTNPPTEPANKPEPQRQAKDKEPTKPRETVTKPTADTAIKPEPQRPTATKERGPAAPIPAQSTAFQAQPPAQNNTSSQPSLVKDKGQEYTGEKSEPS
ncbi:MAG: hypothetical protein GY731_09770, partial [Gammaproteobacteria bacterium]|nr:hypothetical protein [Gammaproteobacteria bacterium]